MPGVHGYALCAGLVELRETVEWLPSQQQFMLHGSPVINDCVYRNRYSFHRILVIDFDEVIMPRRATSLSGLLAQLDAHAVKAGKASLPAFYIFGNTYFFLELPPDVGESPYLTFTRYTRRVAPSVYGYSVKSMIDPQACVNMHNHYCWSVTPGYMARNYLEVVNETFAVNQHYKHCHLNATECAVARSVHYVDDTVARFKGELKQRVRDKVSAILHHNI